MESIITAIITGGLALVGIIITNMMSNKSIETKLTVGQAVTDEKIDNLSKSLERHTSTLEQVPVIKHRVDGIEKRVDKLEERVNTLDRRKT